MPRRAPGASDFPRGSAAPDTLAVPRFMQTPRLSLRPLGLDEARALLEGVESPDAPWSEGYPHEGSLVAAAIIVRSAELGVDVGPFGQYLIVRREDGRVIGDIGFPAPPDEDGTVIADFGLAPPARGQGYATEALRALLAWAVEQPRVQRVHVLVHSVNEAGRRVLERAGMRRVAETASGFVYESP